MRILIIHKDNHVIKPLKKRMQHDGWDVAVAYSGEQGLLFGQTLQFETIVLEIRLPDVNGFELMRRFRVAGNRTPVIFLTARHSVPELVRALDLGADDYVATPFSVLELMARVRAVSRRGPVPELCKLQVADLTIDFSACEVIRANQPLRLSKNEFQLLELLVRHKGQIVRRQLIAETIWRNRKSVVSSPVEALIKLLRKKVDRGREEKLIVNVRGFGYCMRG
jgi:two-component system copper resistance phosphate regulon response regulator CusR